MPVERIRNAFARRAQEGNAACIAFIIAGFDSKRLTVEVLLSMERSGADVIEVGIPFSDPLVDGPAIQDASKIALSAPNNTTLNDCLWMVSEGRRRGLTCGVVFMTYVNPLLRNYSEREICNKVAQVGGDGFIVVDLPLEASDSFRKACKEYQLCLVPLITLTTPPERIIKVASLAEGFIYLVCITGVSGTTLSTDVWSQIRLPLTEAVELVKSRTDVPVAIGFGIAGGQDVQRVLSTGCDGFIVGSAYIKAIKKCTSDPFNDEGVTERCSVVEELCSELNSARVLDQKNTPQRRIENAAPSLLMSETDMTKWNFGAFGGRYVPETLMMAHNELAAAFEASMKDETFLNELDVYRRIYIGGPTPIYHCKNLSQKLGGAQIWLKREELAHTGAHKINNAIGQSILAIRLGKKRIIAETGAGQHGVAAATACAHFGLECVVYMGAVDCERQKLNVFRMKILGATVVPVTVGTQTLKDAINEAMRDWVSNIRTTHYLVGSAVGPHPFPTMVREFQSVIGREARSQMLCENPKFKLDGGPGTLPDAVVACVGGGSNAIGIFSAFIPDTQVKLIGVEGGGVEGPGGTLGHAATICAGSPGIFHGVRTYLLQDTEGQIMETNCISAGLDYPAVGPEHACLKDTGRATYTYATDSEAVEALQTLSGAEGIIPALESSHAMAHAIKIAPTMRHDQTILVMISGRGDKDMVSVAKYLGVEVNE